MEKIIGKINGLSKDEFAIFFDPSKDISGLSKQTSLLYLDPLLVEENSNL